LSNEDNVKMQASLCGNDLRRNTLRSGALFVAALLFTGTFAGAQQRNAQPADRLELAIMYSGSYANLSSGNNKFWLNGGTAELAGQIHRGLGVVCNLTGLHTANTGASVPLNLLTTTFGPRYTWTPARRSGVARTVSIFGEGLAGEAHGFNGLFPGPSSAAPSSLSLAVQVGGGVDVGLSRHFSLRAVQASWLRTQFSNTTTNVQNNLQLGAGIIFHSANR
jgi:hypothetical protein